jgi:serine/threonine-protein kinase RsbW
MIWKQQKHIFNRDKNLMAQWQITIESNFSAIREASQLLKEYCAQCHISPELGGQLELMMVEALNNVIEHAYQGEDGHEVHIELLDKPQYTAVCIRDFGLSAPNLMSGDNATFPDEDSLPEGGWGLPLIQALADSIDYCSSNENNLLTLTKNKQ